LILSFSSLSLQFTDDRVKHLPGYDGKLGVTYSGFVEVNQDYGANLFYYFVESQSSPSTDPLVLWLQGGPGCSSLFGAFVENGPLLINENGTIYPNKWSWNAKSNLLFLDQPVGSGYSYVENPIGYVTNEKTAAQEMYIALTTFLQNHPQYSKLDFYIFGESYAGKYVPSLSTFILQANQNNPALFLNLKGIGMGDGWVNPYYQVGAYAPFLLMNGLINSVEADAALATYQVYKGLVDLGLWLAADEVGNSLLESLVLEAGDVDVYDIRYFGGDPTDPISDALNDYLNTPSVQEQLHAGNQSWQMCNADVEFALIEDIEQSVENLLPALLANYQVLNYNGNKDLICNYLGTDTWTSVIGWPGQNSYNNAQNQTWIVAGQIAGSYKGAGNLTHVIVNNAGHMVPFSQPQNSQELLYTFISGGFN